MSTHNIGFSEDLTENLFQLSSYTVKPVLTSHLKIDKMKGLKTGGSLMQDKKYWRMLGAFCNTFDLHLEITSLENLFLSSFWVLALDRFACIIKYAPYSFPPDTYNADTDEDGDKKPSQHGGDLDITIPHRWHGNHEEVQTLPVSFAISIAKVEKYITRVLQLKCRILKAHYLKWQA